MERGEFPRKFACFPEAEEDTRLVNTKWTGKLGGDQKGNSCQELTTLEDTAPGRRETSDPRVHSGCPWSSCWSLRKSTLVHHFECSWAKSLHVSGWCSCVCHTSRRWHQCWNSGDLTYSQGIYTTDAKHLKSCCISNVKSDTSINPVKELERQGTHPARREAVSEKQEEFKVGECERTEVAGDAKTPWTWHLFWACGPIVLWLAVFMIFTSF